MLLCPHWPTILVSLSSCWWMARWWWWWWSLESDGLWLFLSYSKSLWMCWPMILFFISGLARVALKTTVVITPLSFSCYSYPSRCKQPLTHEHEMKRRRWRPVYVSPAARLCLPVRGTLPTARGWTAGGSARTVLPWRPAEAEPSLSPELWNGWQIHTRINRYNRLQCNTYYTNNIDSYTINNIKSYNRLHNMDYIQVYCIYTIITLSVFILYYTRCTILYTYDIPCYSSVAHTSHGADIK